MATTDWTKSEPPSADWGPAAAPDIVDWSKREPDTADWSTVAPTTEPGDTSQNGEPIGLLLALTHTNLVVALTSDWSPVAPSTADWTPVAV